MPVMNWDDARILLAIARQGSFSGAAAELRIDETTIARRLKRFETSTRSKVFLRRELLQTPTESGAAILRQAERVEAEVARLYSLSRNSIESTVSRVRLTATSAVAKHYLTPALPSLVATELNILLSMLCTDQNLSFARWETDMAVRLARPQDGRLVMRKLADINYAVFGPSDPALARRLRARPNDWVSYPARHAGLPSMRYVNEQLNGHAPVLISDEVDIVAAAAAQGLGRVVLSEHIGRVTPGLKRLNGIPGKREAWLLIHPELRDVPVIRGVADWLVATFAATVQAAKP